MNLLIQSALFGLIGGIVRGVVGIVKSQKSKKKFNLAYFAFTIVCSGIIGVFAGLLVSADYKLTMLAGYAGMDLIESIYKISRKKK